VDLIVAEMQPLFKLDADDIRTLDVADGTIENRVHAGLLGGRGKFLLEASLTIMELVTAALFQLDALLANGLAAASLEPRAGALKCSSSSSSSLSAATAA
jgi:hypothetical protein